MLEIQLQSILKVCTDQREKLLTNLQGTEVKKLEPLYIAVGNIKWCSHFGRLFGGPSK
jgi:hypothetical protein